MSEYQPGQGIIDVEKRKGQAEYTLGDPTVFPPEFLSWLKRFIEQSGIQLPASSIFGNFQPGAGSVRGLAPGIIIPFGGPNAPPGALPCNGQQVPRDTYPKLYDVITNTWGPSDALNFTLPDLRDRTLFGAGTKIPLAATDGMPVDQRGAKHRHTATAVTDATKIVDVGTNQGVNGGGGDGIRTGAVVTPTVGLPNTPLDGPAYAGILYVITTG